MRSPSLVAAFLLLVTGCATTRVPDLCAQGRVAAPQAITSVQVSPGGQLVIVTTLGSRHEPNVWVLTPNGELRFGRNVAPWAPFQAAALDSGAAFGVGLAYSRVTSPYPTISLFGGEKDEETYLEDSLGERGWLRYGEGDWRNGWLQSHLGDLLVRAGDTVITVRGHNGAMRMTSDGRREKYPMRDERPYRMSASADGRTFASGYLVPDVAGLDAETRKTVKNPPPLIRVTETVSGKELWSTTPKEPLNVAWELPSPAADLPELAACFNLKPDASVPFRVAASVSLSADGSTVAAAEYVGRLWVRRGAFLGRWDPPYHVVPFVPRQRGNLLVVTASGSERIPFPQDGLFDVRFETGRILAVPQSWFARGMGGSSWLPTDPGAQSIYEFDAEKKAWRTVMTLPDSVSDSVPGWVSCWDGRLYRLEGGTVDLGSPARLAATSDGGVIAGTDQGELISLDATGKVRWRKTLPSAPPPVEAPIKPVFDGVPVYAVGRTGKEHAYVGDIWLIKTAAGGILVDAAGSSALPSTLRRIQSAGVEFKDIHHLLHSHSHGDHSGAGYLWRSMGLKIVAPESAAFALSWLMPMLTDYGVWVPRPVDVPLPLKRPGDEVEFTIDGQKIRAVFVPGHSLDSVIYLMEAGGKRIAFTGDVGFQAPSDILHRCWTDVANAESVVDIMRKKVIPFHPDVVFTGHGGRAEGTAFLEDLVQRTEESIRKAKSK